MAQEFHKLARKIFIRGSVTALSGLHIGGGDSGIGLGGADQLVVRDAAGRPYLPGSTLKGRLRSLLERASGQIRVTGGHGFPCDWDSEITRLFGRSSDDTGRVGVCAARLLVRDGALENAEEILASPGTDLPYTEVKTEIQVDRITSRATPRHLERVPAGARFGVRMVLTVYEGDDEQALLRLLFEGLGLLQDDSLGGHGSRGYGEVAIALDSVTARERAAYESGADAGEHACEIPASLRAGGGEQG